MKLNHEKISRYLFYALITLEIIIIVFMSFKRHDNISFGNEPLYLMNKDWTYINDTGTKQMINLPTELDAGEDKAIIISHKLPVNTHHITALGILTTHQSVTAYLGHEMIYSRINHSDNHLFNVPKGKTWNLIELPPDSAGKTIVLMFTSKYTNFVGKINEVHVGTKSSILLHNIETFGVGFLLSILIFVSGIALLIVYYFLKKFLSTNKSILYLGWFSILSSVWMTMESNLTQIFLSNAYVISSLTYLSFMTLPIPILFYIASIENFHYKKTILRIIYLFTGNAFLLIALQAVNVADFHESIYLLRLEIMAVFGIAFISLCLELFYHRNTQIRVFTISSGILFTFGFIELFSYSIQTERNTGKYFQVGFLIFISLLSWNSLKKAVDVIKLSETAKIYKMLATRDPLTNCRSRVAYEKDLARVDLNKNIVIFLADVNNTKQVNDTYGHHAGDEVIILCSQCLLKAFGRRVYRIGGDEFVCIEYDMTRENIEAMLDTFLIECKKANEDTPYSFDVSVGYAFFDKLKDKTIHDTVARADKDMYERKIKMKE
jgi:diguanylate cyclase (GGDEF)-like protein